jgi:hypothetical protein
MTPNFLREKLFFTIKFIFESIEESSGSTTEIMMLGDHQWGRFSLACDPTCQYQMSPDRQRICGGNTKIT